MSKKTAPIDDIDLSAALPPTTATQTKRGRGRPRSTAPKPPRKYKVRKDKGVKKKRGPDQFPYIDNNILVNNNIVGMDSINQVDNIGGGSVSGKNEKMLPKELKFLEIYFKGGINQEKAMELAGYGDYNEDYRGILARKIISKYEARAQDSRNILRAMGAGEVAVVEGLMKLAKGAKSEMVRLNAWSMLAKCLGLTKDQIEGAGGITIIFDAPDSPGPVRQVPPAGGEPEPITYQQPVRVLQITK